MTEFEPEDFLVSHRRREGRVPLLVLLVLLARAKARDWKTDEPIFPVDPEEPVDFHHIYPRKLVGEHEWSNSVANITVLFSASNRSIAQCTVREVFHDSTDAETLAYLREHMVPVDMEEILWKVGYKKYFQEVIEARAELLAEKANELMESLGS